MEKPTAIKCFHTNGTNLGDHITYKLVTSEILQNFPKIPSLIPLETSRAAKI
jgi:hypothetical protein